MRASKRPLAILCPSSGIPTNSRIEPVNEAAQIGSAAHLIVQRILNGDHPLIDEEPSPVIIEAVCRTRGVDEKEVSALVHKAIRRWREIRPKDGTSIEVEQDMQILDFTGTPDVSWLDDDGIIRIVDWKFGREMRDYYHQLAQYAWLKRAGLRMQGAWTADLRILVSIEYIRLGKTESYEVGNTELDEWFVFVTDRETEAGTVYSPGDHCGFCRHSTQCQARHEYIVSSSNAISGIVKKDAHSIAQNNASSFPVIIGSAYDRYKAVKRAIGAYENALDSLLDSGAAVPIGNGYSLKRDIQKIDEIDPQAAWPVLTAAGFTREDMAEVVSVSKGAVEDITKSRAPKRGGAAAVRELMAQLEAAGAVHKKDRRMKVEIKDGE